jgi:hypothetical protein
MVTSISYKLGFEPRTLSVVQATHPYPGSSTLWLLCQCIDIVNTDREKRFQPGWKWF